MRKGNNKIMVVLVALITIVIFPLAVSAADTVTIEGEVNDSYQIVDSNGQVYEIGETSQGNVLVENHMGEKAKVTGTLAKDGDAQIISVTKFEIVEE